MVKDTNSKKITLDHEEFKQYKEDLAEFKQYKERLEERMKQIQQSLTRTQKTLEIAPQERIETALPGLTGDIASKETLAILKYIKDNQDKYKELDYGLTKQHIAKYMDESQLASRPTSLRLIDGLLSPRYRIIKDDKKRHNARSRLIINPDFDFRNLEMDILTGCIKEIRERFQPLNDETRGTNTVLIDNLLNAIDTFRQKIERERIRMEL